MGSIEINFDEHCRLCVSRSEVYDHTNALPRCGDRRDRRGVYLELDPLDVDTFMLLNHLPQKSSEDNTVRNLLTLTPCRWKTNTASTVPPFVASE